MDMKMTKSEQNLILLQSLIPGNEKLYIWCYGLDGHFVECSCPEASRDLLEIPLTLFGVLKKAQDHAKSPARTKPLILGSPVGMQWAVSLESARKENLLFITGPVFYTAPAERQLRTALRPFTHERAAADWAGMACRRIGELPVMSYAIFSRYALMVHNTLTGQQLGLEALEQATEREGSDSGPGIRDRNKIYLAEQALLQMVREGNINYQTALQGSIGLSPGTPVQGSDPLRQMKISITVFTTLVSRAAMEGGLSPEIAYELGDSYIRTAEESRDSGELSALALTMYHDFIYRVHHQRMNPNYSHAIRKCCDYIQLGVERKIRVADLASLCGYTEYYLTEKFKKETGQSITSYIRRAKTDRAKMLLASTDLSIGEIADKLAFNTVNYFIQCYKETEGCTPAQYRKRLRQGN